MDQLDKTTVELMAASKDPYMRVLASLADLHAKKAADYDRGGIKNEDYFPFGNYSYAQMVWLKVLRIRSLMHDARAESNESMKDSFRDLANYAIFALMRNDE